MRKPKSNQYDYFLQMLSGFSLPVPVPEYQFHPYRKWRIDFAFPEHKLAMEIEGGIWVQGRHNRGASMIKEMEKYNELAKMRWFLMRFTPQQVKIGYAAGQLAEWFDNEKEGK